MPSPLKFVWAKILTVSEVSTEIAAASALPRFARTCLAEARSALPSAPASLMFESASGPPLAIESPFRSRAAAHAQAAISSGGRMRPSLSVSIRSRVAPSNSIPRVGHASATHSFWSS